MKNLSISFLLISLMLLAEASFGQGMRKLDNNTFRPGEFLKYRVHYGLITAGFATVKVGNSMVREKDRPCYHIVVENYTTSTFDVFYKVRDKYESFFDQDALLSLRFNRYIEEGKFISYTETHFDHLSHKARYINNKKQVSYYSIPQNIQDVISAFYYARTRYDNQRLKIGDRISLQNFIDRKTVALQAELKKREEIKVEGVKYKALKFNLLIEEAGMVTDNSKIEFWITDDANKIPIRIKSDLPIGSLKADLVESKNLLHPLSARKD